MNTVKPKLAKKKPLYKYKGFILSKYYLWDMDKSRFQTKHSGWIGSNETTNKENPRIIFSLTLKELKLRIDQFYSKQQ